ncbi:MAG: exodeoxyribonuclease I [Patescibacteria group bacterium]|nr:exodeoxyribonuclease I [Patescibacteria group bacterium]
MAGSFFFYDLETSGLDPRSARIMQFAGQRTDMDLKPVGDPINVMVRLTPDTVPSPDAIMVTGITPQQTLADGLTEVEFLKLFHAEVVQPGTIYVGFNTVRFDDEFMRHIHWRNFYDPYEWSWANDCSRWDILDLIRMTRALRPGDVEWPFSPEGKATNRLELLTKLNGLDHEHAHDALNDVLATIAVTKLVRSKQPDLFNYLLFSRDKKSAAKRVESGQPFVYTSGRYPSETLHTTAAVLLTKHPQAGSALVYDLRHDPTPYMQMSPTELADIWRYNPDRNAKRLPVKTMKYNRCPAVAPLGVLKEATAQENIALQLDRVSMNYNLLKSGQQAFAKNVLAALRILDNEREAKQAKTIPDVDARLYEKFMSDNDKNVCKAIRAAQSNDLTTIAQDIKDERLQLLLPLYKARNFPKSLTDEERIVWDEYCKKQVFEGETRSKLAKYFERLGELAETDLTDNQKYILEELQLYGQSIIPGDVAD